MTPEAGTINILVQGGAVAIALVALYIIYRLTLQLSKDHREISDQHRQAMERNTSAWIDNTKALTELRETIKH